MSFQQCTDRNRIFYEKNMDAIKSIFKGDLYNIEFDSKILGQLFDKYSNVDFVYSDLKSLYGISARINYASHSKRHLTIRYERCNGAETEFSKAIRAYDDLESDPIISSFHLQMDSDQEYNIECAIIVNKRQLFLYIRQHIDFFKEHYLRHVKDDNNAYFKIPYEFFPLNDLKHKIFEFPTQP